jgi:hypothetical protein
MLLIAYLAREEMNCNGMRQTAKKENSLFYKEVVDKRKKLY